ncbi:hypothetical protein K449DRAFT_442182 [Hypoxylon sp. EC38]|nr:hypothetical protein K449DRAFT_442182 [Hypoxylon sp. EC38]
MRGIRLNPYSHSLLISIFIGELFALFPNLARVDNQVFQPQAQCLWLSPHFPRDLINTRRGPKLMYYDARKLHHTLLVHRNYVVDMLEPRLARCIHGRILVGPKTVPSETDPDDDLTSPDVRVDVDAGLSQARYTVDSDPYDGKTRRRSAPHPHIVSLPTHFSEQAFPAYINDA